MKKNLAQRYQDLFYATQFYVLLDIYRLTTKLRQRLGKPWKVWFDFTESSYFQDAVMKYAKAIFKRTYDLIPASERNNPDKFYKQAGTVGIAQKSLGLPAEFNNIFQKAYSEYEVDYQTV